MNINCFTNPDNIVYSSMDRFISSFEREMKVGDLRYQIEAFREDPKQDGKLVLGLNRTSIRILIPKLMFEERFENDENIWVYAGRSHPCYCLEKTEPWRDKAYFFFTHKDCEFYPCHATDAPDRFNCLFCFCPLYCLGDRCGGNYTYYGDTKDCSHCLIPHLQDSYGYIMGRFNEIAEIAGRTA